MRGSPPMPYLAVMFHRSIPASAGQPEMTQTSVKFTEVYPRECGAAPWRKVMRSL